MPIQPHKSPGDWPQPSTAEELGASALAFCAGTAGRYEALAEVMARHGRSELAAVFEALAGERKILEQAILKRGAQVREESKLAGPTHWAGPEDDQAIDRDEEAQSPHLSSPYKALAFAVRNAEHAFRFYSYVAATATSDAMRALAEWLAMEELTQAAHLRRRRRRAYRARHAAGGSVPSPNPRQVDSLADLLTAAIVMERKISRQLAGAAAAGASLLSLVEQVRRHVDDLMRTLNACSGLHPPATWELTELAELGTPEKAEDEEAQSRETRLALAESERAFAFYNTVVRTASNEAVMLEAQRLSQNALQVISTIKSYKA